MERRAEQDRYSALEMRRSWVVKIISARIFHIMSLHFLLRSVDNVASLFVIPLLGLVSTAAVLQMEFPGSSSVLLRRVNERVGRVIS